MSDFNRDKISLDFRGCFKAWIFLTVQVFLTFPTASAMCRFLSADHPNHHDPNTVLQCNNPISLFEFDKVFLKNVTRIKFECESEWTRPTPSNISSLAIPRLRSIKISGCGEEVLRWLQPIKHSGQLPMLNLTQNKMKGLEWQVARRLHASKIILIDNPIECSCSNRWLYTLQPNMIRTDRVALDLYLQLPTMIQLNKYNYKQTCNVSCPAEDIQLQPPIIDTTLNSTASLTCKMNGSRSTKDFQPEDLFIWLKNTEKAHEERKKRWEVSQVAPDTYRMNIWNLTSDDLGIVLCECLGCVAPKYAQSELRFDTLVTTKVEHNQDESHLLVHGFPLRNLTMTLRRTNNNVEETKNLVVRQEGSPITSFFDSKIQVRYRPEQSFFYLKHYQFYFTEDTELSDYEMKVCTPRDCTTTNVTLGHVAIKQRNYFPPQSSISTGYLIFGLFALATFGGVLLYVVRYYRRDKTVSKLTSAVSWHKNRGFRRISKNTTTTEATSLKMNDSLSSTMSNYSLQHVPIIDKDHLVLEEKIGQGAFGEVFLANWSTRRIKIAVKVLHDIQIDAQIDKEAAMLAALDHDNVVRMYGVSRVSEQQSLYLIMELMNMGDLKTYVKLREPQCENYSQFPPALLTTELINIAQQVCAGLCYIHIQQIVHRDLAARNCLVSGETDMKICAAAFRPPITVKISDFGMSRRLYSQAEYYKMGDKQTALPVRWLPPECLESGRFTYQSDMWAFGVTLYEIFTFGAMPYGDLSNTEALLAVVSGVRPTIPTKCPQEIVELMKDCWKTAPDERPPADEAYLRLRMLQ